MSCLIIKKISLAGYTQHIYECLVLLYRRLVWPDIHNIYMNVLSYYIDRYNLIYKI